MSSIKERFNAELLTAMKAKNVNSGFLTKEKYNDIIEKVNESKSKTTGKKPVDYYRLRRYDVLKVGNVQKLIFPVKEDKSDTSRVRFYIHSEELFTIIHDTHLSIGHGGRNRMLKELRKKYKNITTEEVMIYLNLCESCPRKSKLRKKETPAGPIVFQEINSRCSVDLIDKQSQPDDDFKFILVYQDSLSKFIQLRALKSKQPEEIAFNLIDVFTIFGAPCILECDNVEFCIEIVEEACTRWSDLKIVYGKPRASWTRALIERGKQEIKNMLDTWVETNRTSKWSEGLRFVQFMKNRAFHEGINCTPYEAMFGRPVKLGLKTSSLPNECIEEVKTEEQLEDLIKSVNNDIENANTEEYDSDASQNYDTFQNDPPPLEVTFHIKKEHDSDEAFVEENTRASRREEKRKSQEENLESQPKKISKFSV